MKAGEQVLKYEMYNPDEKCNCVVRALSKMLEKNVINVKDELINLATEMNHIDYTDVEVFEKYMELNNIIKEKNDLKDVQIKDINFSDGKYIVFCWNKDNFYHLVSIIDNVIYDKKEDTLNLYPISIYKEKIIELKNK